jgi:hypothetical protein
MLYLPYGLSDSCLQYKHKNNNSKNIKVTFLFLSPAHFFIFYSFPPLPYLFHPTYLPSVFAHYFSPVLSLPLSHFVASAPHVLDRLTLLSAHSAPSLLLFRPIPVLSLFVPASKPRHHFPLFRALSPQVHRYILCHASLILPVVLGFSDSLPSLLLVRVFVPLAHLRAHPFSFRSHSFHFLTGISVPPAVILCLFHICALFLFSVALRQYPALFPSAYSVLELCRSLSRFHSQLAPLALFPHYVPWCFSFHS